MKRSARSRIASGFEEARLGLFERILDGDGRSSPEHRRAAFHNAGVPPDLADLIGKVAGAAWQVTDEDLEWAKMSGWSDDQLFELIICAAAGQANRQYEAAMATLEATTGGL